MVEKRDAWAFRQPPALAKCGQPQVDGIAFDGRTGRVARAAAVARQAVHDLVVSDRLR
jgi:hypothetical protein